MWFQLTLRLQQYGICLKWQLVRLFYIIVHFYIVKSRLHAAGLSEISRGLQTSKTIIILNSNNKRSSKINEFIQNIHQFNMQTCIFNDTEKFFNFVELNLKGSLEVTCLIFFNPKDIIVEVSLSLN